MVGIGPVVVKRKGSSVLDTLNIEGEQFSHLKMRIWTSGERHLLESSAYREQ